ncbi:MAG: hypothetical protein KDD70_11625 [Bdellovibrionales bacterium]|nr:hypothetical protein [Bdellovibrionales bacterium]
MAFVTGALCALALAFLYYTFVAPARSFPKLDNGAYLGVIQWESSRGEELPSSVYFQRKGTQFNLLVPNVVPGVDEGSFSGSFVPFEDSDDLFMPIQIQTRGGHFLFFGDGESSSQRGSGEVIELQTGKLGTWVFEPLPDDVLGPSGASSMGSSGTESEGEGFDERSTTLLLSLLLEEQYVSSRLEENQIGMQKFSAEIDDLEEKLTEVDKLKAEGQERVRGAEESLAALKTEKESLLAELGKLAEQLQLARKVTKYGEVLRLSRQAQLLEESLFLADKEFLNLTIPEEGIGTIPEEEYGYEAP